MYGSLDWFIARVLFRESDTCTNTTAARKLQDSENKTLAYGHGMKLLASLLPLLVGLYAGPVSAQNCSSADIELTTQEAEELLPTIFAMNPHQKSYRENTRREIPLVWLKRI